MNVSLPPGERANQFVRRLQGGARLDPCETTSPNYAWDSGGTTDPIAGARNLGKANRILSPLNDRSMGMRPGSARRDLHEAHATSGFPSSSSRDPSPSVAPEEAWSKPKAGSQLRPQSQGGTGFNSASYAMNALSLDRPSLEEPEDDTVRLLAAAFRAKCGSLDRAFTWLNDNSSGFITGHQWSTSLGNLQLDGPLKGMRPRKLFQLIDIEKTNAVTLECWRKVFCYEQDGDATATAGGGAETNQENSIIVELAQVLQDKFGSLDGVFRRIQNDSGRINLVVFSGFFNSILTGSLKKLRSRKLFTMMDANRVGYIDLEMWRTFFNYEQESEPSENRRSARQNTRSMSSRLNGAASPSFDDEEDDIPSILRDVLKAKCGTLDNAYRWLNSNRNGRMTAMQFCSGFTVLKMPDALKSMRSRKLFNLIAGDKSDITLEDWRKYFDYTEEQNAGADFFDAKRGSIVLGLELGGELTEHDYPALLAQAMREHCGNLDRAFRWIDTNRSNDLSMEEWSESLAKLSLDGPIATVPPSDLFNMIDSNNTGSLCMENWHGFFRYSGDDAQGTKIATGNVSVWLAQVLREKHGYLDRAFRWLDNHNHGTGRITSMQWNSALGMWKFEGPLKGYRPQKLFAMIDTQKTGGITLPMWREFFDYEYDDCEEEDLDNNTAIDTECKQLLAKVLVGKCGSLDNAFKWFDGNGNGILSQTEWDSAYKMLAVTGALKDVQGRKLFYAMDYNGGGSVTMEDWRQFFSVVDAEYLQESTAAHQARQSKLARQNTLKQGAARDRQSQLGATSERKVITPPPEGSGRQRGGAQSPQPRPASPDEAAVEDAERDILTADIQQNGLNGAFALAYVLCAKLKSLDAAFRWLDDSRTGNFTKSKWDRLENILRLNLESVTGSSSTVIFKDLDAMKKGCVSKPDWNEYFANVLADPHFVELIAQLQTSSLTERAKKKLGVPDIPKKPDTINEVDIVAENESLDEKNRKASTDPRRPDSRARASPSPTQTKSKNDKSAGSRKASPSPILSQSNNTEALTSKTPSPPPRASVLDSEKSMVASSHDKPKLIQKADAAKETSAPVSVRMSASAHNAAKMQALMALEKENSASATRQRIKDELDALAPDACVSVPSGRPLMEYAFYEEIGWELGYRIFDTSRNDQESRLILHEGPQATLVLKQLNNLAIAENVEVTGINEGFQHMIQDVVMVKKLFIVKVRGQGWRAQVWNLSGEPQEWLQGVRNRCKKLNGGEIVDFPSALRQDKVEIVQAVAEEMKQRGLVAEVIGPIGAANVSIGQLRNFPEESRQHMSALSPGATHDFGLLRPLERVIVENIATELRLKCEVQPKDGVFDVKVIRTGDKHDGSKVRDMKNVAVKYKDDQVVDIDDLLAQLQGRPTNKEPPRKLWVQRFFDKYASGRRDGKAVFIRRKDLTSFAREAQHSAQKAHDRQEWRAISRHFDDLFDETWDLQRIVGSRNCQHGLNFEFFHVFVDKVASEFGWFCISQFVVMS